MTHANRHPSGTRKKILDTACKLFAENGFRGTTVARICAAAKANIAAVNYYFRSKERLYQEAWRHAHDESLKRCPPDGGVSEDRPAEERLEGHVRAGLQRALTGDAVEFRIMEKEMANPTDLLHQVVRDAIRPVRERTQAILRELLGPRYTELDVELCELMVVAPFMHARHHRQRDRHWKITPMFSEEILEDLVAHFTTFALAGIRAIRDRREKGGHND